MSDTLGVLRPLDEGAPILLTSRRVLIGSHRHCHIVIRAMDVAKVHCQLYVEGNCWHVRDVAGMGETRVNASAVKRERLSPGDLLWIGSRHQFEIQYDPESLAGGETRVG